MRGTIHAFIPHTFALHTFLLCALFLSGCTNVTMDMASQPEVYVDNSVVRNAVQVYIQPDKSPLVAPRTLFVPFRVTQQMENATVIGRNISHYIWQNWLQTQVFSVCEFAQINTPYRPDLAIALARSKGADMVVGGYITHIVDGGTTGDSSLSIAIEAYDVQTGDLMWSMAQGGYMQLAKVNDYLLFAVNTRMPMSPMGAIASALAVDMGTRVRHWITPPPPASRWNDPKAF